jgi:hypothetical protein
MLRDATEDLLAFTSFPPGYWKKIWSTEIIESLPGLGSILGAEFLVATGGNLTGFATAGRLAPYAGWCPSPRIPAAHRKPTSSRALQPAAAPGHTRVPERSTAASAVGNTSRARAVTGSMTPRGHARPTLTPGP